MLELRATPLTAAGRRKRSEKKIEAKKTMAKKHRQQNMSIFKNYKSIISAFLLRSGPI